MVCCDCNELRLRERMTGDHPPRTSHPNYMDAWLILVQRIQHYLKNVNTNIVTCLLLDLSFRMNVWKQHFLTWPPPLSLFVSLTLLKETGAFIQCAPKFGESGWMYTQLGVWGSGLPPGTHSPFTYFHLWLSADTKSSKTEYMAFGSSPDTLIFSTGNMRLWDKNNGKKNTWIARKVLGLFSTDITQCFCSVVLTCRSL